MRHAAQCVGRAIRGKTDYGLMIFADKVCLNICLILPQYSRLLHSASQKQSFEFDAEVAERSLY